VAFTYTLPIPAGSTGDLSRIRLKLGDTDPSVPTQMRLEDEEITELYTEYSGSVTACLPECAEALAGKFGRAAARKQTGPFTLEFAQGRFATLMAMAATLRRRAALAVTPYSGGQSISDKEAEESNTDRVNPSFQRGMLDNPDAGPQEPNDPLDGQPV